MAEQTLTLILITHNLPITHIVYSIHVNQIPSPRMQRFLKNPFLSHFPIKIQVAKVQPRVIM